MEYYLKALNKALLATTKEVMINCWTLSKESFETVVKASMNATKIIVGFSKIDCSSNFDFTGPNYTTKYFGLPHCGDYVKEYWSDEPDKLKLIIEAIANTNMKTSLKTLNL